MKKNFIFIQTIFVATVFVLPAYAQTVTQTPRQLRQELRTTIQQERLDDRVTNLKTRADKEIERRIDALNKINARLSDMKHLTDSQKTSFATQMQTEITTLTALKAKIDADTDLATLRTDVQSIVKEYRVYVLFIPQMQLVASADRVLNIVDQFSTLVAKLQTRISEAQTAGKDVTSLQATITDMQNKIADAKLQANNAIAAVLPLTPAGYPGNASVLHSARSMLQAARTDLMNAGKDAKTIIQGLRALKPTPTPGS